MSVGSRRTQYARASLPGQIDGWHRRVESVNGSSTIRWQPWRPHGDHQDTRTGRQPLGARPRTGWRPTGCPPLSILSPTPLASQTRTPTPLSATTRRLTPSLRLNSPSPAPSETRGAGSSTPSGSAGSNKPRLAHAVTSRSTMATEQLTYAQIAERLSVSPEAARAIVKRHRLPRSRSNDGKTLAAIDLKEIRHKPLPARSPRGHRSVTTVVATLKARIATLEAELVAEQQRSAGHRADFERERERADQLVTTQDRMVAELEALRSLLEGAQPAAPPVTS